MTAGDEPPPCAAHHTKHQFALQVVALMFCRAASLGALASAFAIGGAVASYLGWFAASAVLILAACALQVLARSFAKRARSLAREIEGRR